MPPDVESNTAQREGASGSVVLRQSLLTAMEEAHKSSPNKSIEVKYIYEDGDSVITHSLVKKENMDIAVVHIFRFENDKVVELWDLNKGTRLSRFFDRKAEFHMILKIWQFTFGHA